MKGFLVRTKFLWSMLFNVLTQVQSSAWKDVKHKCGRIAQEKGHSVCVLFIFYFSVYLYFCFLFYFMCICYWPWFETSNCEWRAVSLSWKGSLSSYNLCSFKLQGRTFSLGLRISALLVKNKSKSTCWSNLRDHLLQRFKTVPEGLLYVMKLYLLCPKFSCSEIIAAGSVSVGLQAWPAPLSITIQSCSQGSRISSVAGCKSSYQIGLCYMALERRRKNMMLSRGLLSTEFPPKFLKSELSSWSLG